MSNSKPLIRRAYVIVWWPEDDGIWCLSGREQALHKKALSELLQLAPKVIEIDERGADHAHGIGNNLGGTLLIARTALAGGRVDGGETFEEAAVRELGEEFGLVDRVTVDKLEAIDATPVVFEGSEIRFFSLDLRTVVDGDPYKAAVEHCRTFLPNSDKRSLQVVRIEELECLLREPQINDALYIQAEMERLVSMLPEPSTKLVSDLFDFQMRRSLAHQVDAVGRFTCQKNLALGL
jgi:8-oxo-dGTP pyrophosphatase MutT (NUDIX family)